MGLYGLSFDGEGIDRGRIPTLNYDVTLDSGDIVTNLDFGNMQEDTGIEVHGTKFLDANGNGRQDGSDEPGLPGVTIYLDANFNGALDANEPRAITMQDDPENDANQRSRHVLANRVAIGRSSSPRSCA